MRKQKPEPAIIMAPAVEHSDEVARDDGQLRARLRAAEIQAKGERGQHATATTTIRLDSACKNMAGKPVYCAAGVHVAAHLLREQQVVDGVLGVSDAAARDARHVRAPAVTCDV